VNSIIFILPHLIIFTMEPFAIIKATILISFVILFPGLLVTLAIFPKKDEIQLIERLGLSFVFGLIPQLILYFLDKNFSVPINSSTTLTIIVIVSVISIVIWQLRIREPVKEEIVEKPKRRPRKKKEISP